MPHRTFNFLMFYPLFLLLAITCFDMISRRILFTKNVQKTLKLCVLNFEFSSMHDKDFFVWLFFFLTVASIPNFCSRSLPVSFVLFVLDPLWYDFPGCTCYWDDERIREANKNFLLQKMTLFGTLILFALLVYKSITTTKLNWRELVTKSEVSNSETFKCLFFFFLLLFLPRIIISIIIIKKMLSNNNWERPTV